MIKKMQEEILKLKKENDICILAHCYQRHEILEVADFVGDSYALAKKAAAVENKTVIMCGVRFMAETVKILSPEKTVILSSPIAGCPMAEQMSKEYIENIKKSYPDYAIRKAMASEKLKEYYSQYNLKSYIEFLDLKYGITYGNGLFDTEQYLNNQRHGNFTHYFLLDGMPFTPLFRYIANGLHFFTVLMAVISGVINWRKKQWNAPMLMQIILVGNIIFFSFWETKARYAFGITPVLLFLTVYSLKEIAEFAAKKISFKKHIKM